jgi:hypothetical protein
MIKGISVAIIKIYQGSLRYMLPCACRFTPTCSEYAKQAIERFGFFRGAFKALVRLFHCHPYSGKSGFDPVK